MQQLFTILTLLATLALPTMAVAQPLGNRPGMVPRETMPHSPAGRKILLQRPAVAAPAVALPAHPAVVRIYVVEKGSQSLGSGTLIDVRDPYALVVTNWHVIREAAGEISVVFPDGFRSAARVVQHDADWDLAALSIWKPNALPVRISTEPPKPGEPLNIAGYGTDGTFRAVSGACTQYLSPGQQHPHEIVELAAAARQGDSGGPILNARGELAGVLFGSAGNTTSGSYGPRVLKFLEPLLKSSTAVDAPPGVAPPPPVTAAAPIADVPRSAMDDQLVSLNPTAPPQPAAPLAAIAEEDVARQDNPYQIEHTPVDALVPGGMPAGYDADTASLNWTAQDFLGRTPIEQGKAALSIVGLFSLLMFVLRYGKDNKKDE